MKTLAQTIDRFSDVPVRERLVEANFEEPDGPGDDGIAHYAAWCAAQDRVDLAMEGARDLLAVARAGEEFKIASGRPRYVDWTFAIGSLREVWTDDLGREATISGHASDPRRVKLSPLVQFVHRCMRWLGEDITDQACRTILQNLRKQRV